MILIVRYKMKHTCRVVCSSLGANRSQIFYFSRAILVLTIEAGLWCFAEVKQYWFIGFSMDITGNAKVLNHWLRSLAFLLTAKLLLLFILIFGRKKWKHTPSNTCTCTYMANHHLKIIREMMNVSRLNQVLIALLSASVWWVILNILIAVVWISHLVKRVYRATTKVFFGFWPRNLLSKKELKSYTSASVLRILGMVLYRASAYTDKGIYV